MSVVREKAFDKIQHQFMLKTRKKTSNRREFC